MATNKQVNDALRKSIHRPPASPRVERQPTASEQFSEILRAEGLRSVRVSVAKPEEVQDAPQA